MRRPPPLYPGYTYAGEVIVKDIGISNQIFEEDKAVSFTIDKNELGKYMPDRKQDSHKGSYGKTLIIAGCKGMAGAAYLNAYAAYMTGAGLVQIYTVEENRQVLQQLLPEAIITTYDFFDEISLKENCTKIATAHNSNDNVETVIMNLTRGTSLQGICGIPYKRDRYIRPLLDTTREEIEEYLKTNNLEFITDSTNLTDDYTRNRIRHNVLPVLFSVNSSFDKAFLKYLDSVSTSNDFIVEEAKKILQKSRCADGFDCAQIKNCHMALKKQVIALILKEKKANNISREHILAVDNIIKKGGSTNIGNGIVVTVERDLLYFGNVKITEDFSFEIQKESQIIKTPVGDVKFDVLLKEDLQKLNNKTTQNLIDYDKLSNRFFLRNRRDGDKYCPKNRNVTKTLKKLFNDEKIPVSKRSQMLILTDDREIVWTEYFGVSEKYKTTNQTKKYLQIKNVGE